MTKFQAAIVRVFAAANRIAKRDRLCCLTVDRQANIRFLAYQGGKGKIRTYHPDHIDKRLLGSVAVVKSEEKLIELVKQNGTTTALVPVHIALAIQDEMRLKDFAA